MINPLSRDPSPVQLPVLALLAILLLAWFTPNARAVISEPDNRVWGSIVLGTNIVSATQTNIVVEARRTLSSPPIASYRMGDSTAYGNFYSLAIPLESVNPISDPNATREGEQIVVLVHNGQFVRYLTLYSVGPRGKLVRLDLGDIDSDNNGLVDNWERQYFGAAGQNPNGDPDRDGVSNRNEMLGATNPLVPDARHPADTNPTNNIVSIEEVTAYALAWKTGKPWPVAPTNIPVDFVARAGFLWKNGERYIMDTNAIALGAPLWWTNVPPPQPSLAKANLAPANQKSVLVVKGVSDQPAKKSGASDSDQSKITRAFPEATSASGGLFVTLSVAPTSGVSAYVVEEKLPDGQSANQINNEGEFDISNGRVRWGPFFDAQPRELSYRLALPPGSASSGVLAGVASFDGWNVNIAGASVLVTPVELSRDPIQISAKGEMILSFRGLAGQPYEIEVSNDLQSWSRVTTITADQAGRLQFNENIDSSKRQLFYRARRREE